MKEGKFQADMNPELELRNLNMRFDEWKKSMKARLAELAKVVKNKADAKAAGLLKTLQRDFDDWKKMFKSRANETESTLKRVERGKAAPSPEASGGGGWGFGLWGSGGKEAGRAANTPARK